MESSQLLCMSSSLIIERGDEDPPVRMVIEACAHRPRDKPHTCTKGKKMLGNIHTHSHTIRLREGGGGEKEEGENPTDLAIHTGEGCRHGEARLGAQIALQPYTGSGGRFSFPASSSFWNTLLHMVHTRTGNMQGACHIPRPSHPTFFVFVTLTIVCPVELFPPPWWCCCCCCLRCCESPNRGRGVTSSPVSGSRTHTLCFCDAHPNTQRCLLVEGTTYTHTHTHTHTLAHSRP